MFEMFEVPIAIGIEGFELYFLSLISISPFLLVPLSPAHSIAYEPVNHVKLLTCRNLNPCYLYFTSFNRYAQPVVFLTKPFILSADADQ